MLHLQDMDIATRIRTARALRGISQRELAKRLNVSPSAVAQWETGQTTPTIGNRVDLSKELAIPFAELMPEADSLQEMTIRDPATILFVRKYLELPAPVREVLLMQVVGMTERLAAGSSADSAV
jgi:transcriptional regulator with XRE-family HTH domain